MRQLLRKLIRSVGLKGALLALLAACSGSLLFLAASSSQAATEPQSGALRSDITDADALEILGQPLPRPLFLPLGLTRTSVGAEPAQTDPLYARGPRHVRQSFSIGGRPVALLTVNAGTLGRVIDPGAQSVSLAGVAATTSTHEIRDGTIDATYYWEAHGLVFVFHINLVQGLSADLAGQVAASVK